MLEKGVQTCDAALCVGANGSGTKAGLEDAHILADEGDVTVAAVAVADVAAAAAENAVASCFRIARSHTEHESASWHGSAEKPGVPNILDGEDARAFQHRDTVPPAE